jgi:predicted dehydrogenase
MKRTGIAMIGVGCISGIYLKNITGVFSGLELVGVCDLVRERAEKAQKEYNVPKIYDTMYDAFADPDVDIVLNLTRPYEHFEVSRAALLAGKAVYSEKPLASTWEDGKELVRIAEEKKLMFGGAPDTFLGGGIQTCRRLIDSGFIGKPLGAAAFMICRGHESWHPDPEFYYKNGGGPMMDMGPYYITALINLLGGVRAVSGVTTKGFAQRIITSEPKKGQVIDVDMPTTVNGILQFDSGTVGTIFTTFDVYYDTQARFEVYGTEGTLKVPDPNCFGGPIMLMRAEDKNFREMPLMYDYQENSRALGLADMAKAMQSGREARADYHQTRHVLEILTSFEKSSLTGQTVTLETHFDRRGPMKNNPVRGILD